MNSSNASALVLSLLIVSLVPGCSGVANHSSPSLTADRFQPVITGGQPPLPSDALYVVQPNLSSLDAASYILEFPKTSSGSAEPAAEITGPAGVVFRDIAVDPAGDLFVQGYRNSNSEFDIYVYPAGATGAATPSAIISNSNAYGLCLDSAGKLYAAKFLGSDGIQVYDPSTPAASPVRTISVPPGIFGNNIATDSSGNIYILKSGLAQDSRIFLLSASGSKNASLLATISGPATGLINPDGLAVDAAGNIYVGSYDSTTRTGSILVFAPGSTGNASPVRTISGPDTDLGSVQDVRVDKTGTVYVNAGRPGPVGFAGHILTFAPGATGNVAPLSDLAPEASDPNHMTEGFGKLAVL